LQQVFNAEAMVVHFLSWLHGDPTDVTVKLTSNV